MYELKKIGKVFTSKFVGTGPSSYGKRIYRPAVSQRLRNTVVYDTTRMKQEKELQNLGWFYCQSLSENYEKRLSHLFCMSSVRMEQLGSRWTDFHQILYINIFFESSIKRDQLYVTCFIISLFNAQHVSDVNTCILRSLRLIC